MRNDLRKEPVTRRTRTLLFAAALSASIGCDQATKHAADALRGAPVRSYLFDTFRLVWATNQGAFLSLGAGLPAAARYWILTIAVGLVLAGVTAYAMVNGKLDGWQTAGYALVAGGGLSNWIDRTRFDGRVVDFMNLGIGPLRTGIFNVADLAIIAGFLILFIRSRHSKLKT